MKKTLLAAILALVAAVGLQAQSNVSYIVGERDAQQFAYGWGAMPGAHVVIGNSSTGAATDLVCPAFRATQDGREVQIFPTQGFAPVSFDAGTASAETVTPTAVSIVTAPSGVEANQSCAQITATFSFTHFTSQNVGQVRSGSYGLQEAIDDAGRAGGMVTIENTWGGTNAMITAATIFPGVAISDKRTVAQQYWVTQGGTALLAAPAVLTNASAGFGVNGANFTGGAYTGSNTYIACITYVDPMGQEGPCSATFTIATSGVATTDQIGFTGPAANTDAVGYKIYITLNGGAYVSAYNVPLVTQPTVVGAYPISNGVCTLTTVETITPACAVTNATYAQTGSGAVVSALTLNTSQIEPELTIASTTSIYVPNPGGRQAYSFTPGSHIGTPGLVAAEQPFTITTAAATVTPNVLGTVNIAPGFMNYIGRTIEVCGYGTMSSSTDTIEAIQFQWDANGQNTAGKGVLIGYENMTATGVLNMSFCQDFITTAVGATATGGSINTAGGSIAGSAAALGVSGAGANTTVGTTALLNLADAARLNVIYLHTNGTDGSGVTLQSLTAKVVN